MKRLHIYSSSLIDGEKGEDDSEEFGDTVYADCSAHISGGQLTVVVPDIWLFYQFTEVIVRTAKATIEDSCEGCLWITAVGGGMAMCVFLYKGEKIHSRPEEGAELI